jgi:hypothetical protein
MNGEIMEHKDNTPACKRISIAYDIFAVAIMVIVIAVDMKNGAEWLQLNIFLICILLRYLTYGMFCFSRYIGIPKFQHQGWWRMFWIISGCIHGLVAVLVVIMTGIESDETFFSLVVLCAFSGIMLFWRKYPVSDRNIGSK